MAFFRLFCRKHKSDKTLTCTAGPLYVQMGGGTYKCNKNMCNTFTFPQANIMIKTLLCRLNSVICYLDHGATHCYNFGASAETTEPTTAIYRQFQGLYKQKEQRGLAYDVHSKGQSGHVRIWPLTEHLPYQPRAVKSYKQAERLENAIATDKLLLVGECRDLSRARPTLYTTHTYRSAQCVKMKTQCKQKGYTHAHASSNTADWHQRKSLGITPRKKEQKKDLSKERHYTAV
uniref:Uncharacterized protein n=1 Tax=Rhipicephalus zambeziensis TaxID=60191 RepID=A0A224Y789_9ACAR